MKINELTEGPLADFTKGLIGQPSDDPKKDSIGNLLKRKAHNKLNTYKLSNRQAEKLQKKKYKKLARVMDKEWRKEISQGNAESNPDSFKVWATAFLGNDTKEAEPYPNPNNSNELNKWYARVVKANFHKPEEVEKPLEPGQLGYDSQNQQYEFNGANWIMISSGDPAADDLDEKLTKAFKNGTLKVPKIKLGHTEEYNGETYIFNGQMWQNDRRASAPKAIQTALNQIVAGQQQ